MRPLDKKKGIEVLGGNVENAVILSDSHCHLDGFGPAALVEVLKQARANHVEIIVCMGKTMEASATNVRLANSHDGVHAAVGIHPWDAVSLTDDLRSRLRELVKSKGVVAIGEIGLDYVRKPETREVQQELLAYQLSLAHETGLPVNVHCNGAHQDMMAMLRVGEGAGLKGVAHGFVDDTAALRDWLDLGFFVSIGLRGLVRDRKPALDTVRAIPLERLLTESDSAAPPSSVPGPADVRSVVERLASIRGDSPEQIGAAATANLRRLLGL